MNSIIKFFEEAPLDEITETLKEIGVEFEPITKEKRDELYNYVTTEHKEIYENLSDMEENDNGKTNN